MWDIISNVYNGACKYNHKKTETTTIVQNEETIPTSKRIFFYSRMDGGWYGTWTFTTIADMTAAEGSRTFLFSYPTKATSRLLPDSEINHEPHSAPSVWLPSSPFWIDSPFTFFFCFSSETPRLHLEIFQFCLLAADWLMFSSHFLAHCGWSRQPVIKETWSRKVVQIFHRGRHAIPRAVYKSSPTVRVTQTSKKKICSALVKHTTWHVRKQKQYLSRHVRVGLGHRPATSRYAGGISQVPLPRKRRASAGQAVSAPYTSNTEFVYLSTPDR